MENVFVLSNMTFQIKMENVNIVALLDVVLVYLEKKTFASNVMILERLQLMVSVNVHPTCI